MANRKLQSDPLLNSRMKRHIKSLGLGSVGEYRHWCSDRGFKSELSKNLTQLENELELFRKENRSAEKVKELEAHLEALGLATVEEYRAWCSKAGVSTGLNKSLSQRRKEIKRKEQLDFRSSQIRHFDAAAKQMDMVRAIAAGYIEEEVITNPGLSRVHGLITQPDCDSARTALFVRLLNATRPYGDFIDVHPVVERYGHAAGNSLIDALYSVTGHADRWIRAPESWDPVPKGLMGRFTHLLRHLFARYDVPAFMDSSWFAGFHPFAVRQQGWFIHIGQGENIRKAGLPLRYTKRMSHHFLLAPDGSTVVEALRWGQIMVLGGSPELAAHVNATHLGETLEHEDFWESVIHFLVNNPMLDFSCIAPIVDYIRYRKFLPEQIIGEDGRVEELDPPEPGFSMKGRRAEPLLELVDAWHTSLARDERRKTSTHWDPSGIAPRHEVVKYGESGSTVVWTITELLTRNALFEEGKAMRHCVKSYVSSCARGSKSVWSLQREDVESGRPRRVMTIAVKNDVRRVVQARGKCNAMPGSRPHSSQEAGILAREEELLREGREVMRRWGAENGISVPRYT